MHSLMFILLKNNTDVTAELNKIVYYQQEFYYCLLNITKGNVCISPELVIVMDWPDLPGLVWVLTEVQVWIRHSVP